MKLRIDDITAEAKELSFAEPEGEINRILEKGPLTEFRIQEPIGVTVSFYRAGPELFFEGGLHASTTATCARCAEEFAAPSDRDFRFILAPKAIGLWGTVVLALLTRFLMWVAMTYFPQTVHGAESGLLMASIILAVSHLFVLVAAVRANPTT